MGSQFATSPWDIMEVAIASNKWREAWFDPENLHKPFGWEMALRDVAGDMVDKVKNACDWGGLAVCIGDQIPMSVAETGTQILLKRTAIAFCAACVIDPEPVSKTVSCGVCAGYIGWNVVNAWQTGWGIGKCIVDNCTSW